MEQDKKSTGSSPEEFPENFPTSAKPIFRSLSLLAAIVALLCYVAYACSDQPEDQGTQVAKPTPHAEDFGDNDADSE